MSLPQIIALMLVQASLIAYLIGVSGAFYVENEVTPSRMSGARRWWTAACVLMIAHIVAAFGAFHGWSHAAAVAHTVTQTRNVVGVEFAGGVYVNYLFVAVWLTDVVWWWWVGHDRFRKRRAAITLTLHVFMLFIVFNATVVFGSTPARVTGLAITALVVVAMARFGRHPSPRP